MKSYENSSVRVILKKDREKSVRNYHPWIFSGAVAQVTGSVIPGDIVPVYSLTGELVAKGFYNPASQIRVRILTFKDETISDDFFIRRISRAYRSRRELLDAMTDAFRVIHGDGDLLSGLVIDKYGPALVMQISSLGMQRLKSRVMEWVRTVCEPEIFVERTEGASLPEEGLEPDKAVHHGTLPEQIIIHENDAKYRVDIWNGQKTGFFLDQRENRRRIGPLSANKKFLNCFSYTGAFSIVAALQGAVTTSVDVSGSALEMARENFRLNGLDPLTHRFMAMSAFDFFYQNKERFEFIVLDPPAFVKKRSHLVKGSRAYKEINRLAMQSVQSGGVLLTCSCSSHVSAQLFQQIIFAAARESGREVQMIGRYGQPSDHPVNIYHPEGEYLKTLLLKVY